MKKNSAQLIVSLSFKSDNTNRSVKLKEHRNISEKSLASCILVATITYQNKKDAVI